MFKGKKICNKLHFPRRGPFHNERLLGNTDGEGEDFSSECNGGREGEDRAVCRMTSSVLVLFFGRVLTLPALVVCCHLLVSHLEELQKCAQKQLACFSKNKNKS